MSAMTMEFDGVRELSMEEVDAVAGGAVRGASVLPAISAVLDHFGNQDGDAFDEGAAVTGAVTAGFVAATAAGCVPCGAIAAGTGLLTAGLVLADTFAT